MVLYLLRNNLNKELLNNSNGTLKVYNDIQIAQADASIYDAHVICLDYNFILEHRIQMLIKHCVANNIAVNVNNVVLQSLFVPGGTLTGFDRQIEKYIKNYNSVHNEA